MAEETDVAEGGSSKVFLILGLLLGVALGGGAGYYFSSKNAPEEGTQQEEKKKASKPQKLISIPFERLAVPVYSSSGNRRQFVGNYFINANVQVAGEDNQIAVKRSTAQLQHGFISAISKSELIQKEAGNTQIDLDRLSEILKKKADEIMGSGVVVDISITEAILMPR